MIQALDGSSDEVLWRPLAAQEVGMTCPARQVLLGGEKGGGKSDWLIAVFVPLLLMAHQKWQVTKRLQHRCRIIIFRKNLEDLKDLIVKSRDLYPAIDPAMGEDGYHTQDKTWTFTSGATVTFRHLDGPEDHRGYNGHEYVGMGFDEVQFIPYEAFKFLTWQVRSKDPDYHANRIIRCTANPGGEEWIVPHFGIDKFPQGGRILTVVVPDLDGNPVEIDRAYIRAPLQQNKHLAPDYYAELAANMNEDEIAQYLEGDWFRRPGAFFSKFLKGPLHYQRSRPLPLHWEWRFALDWHSTVPAALYVGAVDPEGCLYVVDEIHQPGETGDAFGKVMRERWRTQRWAADEAGNRKALQPGDFWGVIDRQAMDEANGVGTVADAINDCGFRVFDAKKSLFSGCVQMKERFLLDARGRPRVIIFEDKCPELVKALSAIKSNAPKDPDTYQERTPHSWALNAFRFLCMEFPLQPAKEIKPMDAQVARMNAVIKRAQQAGLDGGNEHIQDSGYGN